MFWRHKYIVVKNFCFFLVVILPETCVRERCWKAVMPSRTASRNLVFLPRENSSEGGCKPVIFVPASAESLQNTSWEIGSYNLDYGANGREAKLYLKRYFGKRKTHIITPLTFFTQFGLYWKNRVKPNRRLNTYRSIFTYNIDDVLPYTNTFWYLNERNPIRLKLGRDESDRIILHQFNEQDNPPIYRQVSIEKSHLGGLWREIQQQTNDNSSETLLF